MDTPDAFEWDEPKAENNLVKHGLPFEFAIRVFTDPGQLDKIDGRQDYGEERRNIVGVVNGVCIIVTYTMRGNVCRVISARKANRKERKEYGQD